MWWLYVFIVVIIALRAFLKIVLFLATSFRSIMDLHVFASLVFIMDQCGHIAFV
jgi:hypothetical protein